MVIVKILIMCEIIVICSYLGILKSKSYELRCCELKSINGALNMFKSKIEFTYEPIKDIFEEISNVIYKNKSNIFMNTINELKNKNITEAWYEGINKTKNYLNTEDKETLKMMGKLLGKTEKNGQISEIDLTMNLLERQIEKAEIEKNKNSKLYKTLGAVMGIGIVIMLM